MRSGKRSGGGVDLDRPAGVAQSVSLAASPRQGPAKRPTCRRRVGRIQRSAYLPYLLGKLWRRSAVGIDTAKWLGLDTAMSKKKGATAKGEPSGQDTAPTLPPGVKLLRTLRGHEGWIGRIAWSPDGKVLASPSADRTIRLWDAETGECMRTLTGHTRSVIAVAFDPAGEILASASLDHTARLWNASGKLLGPLEGHAGGIINVAFDPKGDILVGGGTDSTVKVWNPATRKLRRSQKGHTGHGLERRVRSCGP